MGLDMYLSAKRFIWFNEEELIDGVTRAFSDLPEGVKPQEVTFEVGYWRKANHIHRWFVENVQKGVDNCGSYSVSDEKLDELLSVCKMVLDNRQLADKYLPTQSGFFFGGTEYTDFYFEDIENTVKIIERAKQLRETKKFAYELEYRASW